jgi:hypothetical protein
LQRKKSEESFGKSHIAREGVASGQAISPHCLGYYKAGWPEMASAKLPPKYIVSRKSQWAVAGRQTGYQRRRLK